MMKNLIRGVLKYYAKTAMFFYYKKIEIVGLDKLPKNKPIFFLPNHQNALIDPLLIATNINGFANYLTRASVFKKPLMAKTLRLLGLLPVYRVRDGFSTLNKNQAIFDECIRSFSKNGKVLAFPEASHNIKRRVRPLSKGFTRIVFQELEENPESSLQLIPVGFNYMQADNCPDSVRVIFGEAIPAKKYTAEMDAQHLRTDVQDALKALTTDIPEANYQEIETRLKDLDLNYLDPTSVNQQIADNFVHSQPKSGNKPDILKSVSKILLIVLLLGPYLLWKYKFKPAIDEIEFVATFRYTVAITLVPLYLILVCGILAMLLGYQAAIAYLVSTLVIDLLYVKT